MQLRSSFLNSDAGLPADVANEQFDVFGDEPGESELEHDNIAAPVFEDPDNIESVTLNTSHIFDRPDSPQVLFHDFFVHNSQDLLYILVR